jgi:hypothetical protein
MRSLIAALVVVAAVGCAGAQSAIEPPVVLLRDISNAPRIARGESVDFDASTTLFMPEGWRETVTSAGEVLLTVHFHSARWYAIEEHARRGARNPFLALYLGEGSRVYGAPFEPQGHLRELITRAEQEFRRRGAPENARVREIELQSFSAGYGAIREILKNPEYVKMTRRVVLADSLYAGITSDTQGRRIPDPENMWMFIDFARKAAAGEKQFLAAHSGIVTGYASTSETAVAIIEALGGKRELVTTGSVRAAVPGLPYPLESRFDKGQCHIWGYAGNTPEIHMAIARQIAGFHLALDREQERRSK